jgi:hypothetical protein
MFVVHSHGAGTYPRAEEGSWIVRTQSGIASGLSIGHFSAKNHEFARYWKHGLGGSRTTLGVVQGFKRGRG